MNTYELFSFPLLKKNATHKDIVFHVGKCALIVWFWIVIVAGIFVPQAAEVFTRTQ